MGRVYLGQSRSGRRLVIKVLNEEYADDPEYRQRFSREVAAAKLISPLYTAAVIDADPLADSPWLATTFIDGPSLEDSVRKNGKLAPRTVMTLAAGLAEALASIHSVGLVHRDLKPSNVLIDANGPRIIDFGIALSGDETRITTSLMVGTPSFMAPERLNGLDAGPAGDMFSLGATLYYAATGTPLVRGGTFYEQVTQVALGRFDLDALPAECRPIIERCLSSEPQRRPTAADLMQILEDLGVSQPVDGWWPDPISSVATLDSARERRRQLSRRRVLMGAGALGVVLAGSGAALWRSRRPSAAPVAPPTPTPSVTPRPRGRMLWHLHSGADPRPGPPAETNAAKVIVDRGTRVISTNAETVYANDTARRRVWTEVLPASTLRIWQWGDSVLAGDLRRLWLLDAATGRRGFEIDLVTAEEARPQDNPDRMTVQIQWVFAAGDRALVGLGTATVAIDRTGKILWRRTRQFDPQGRRTPPPTPMAANATHVVTKESGGTPRIGLRQLSNGGLVWEQTDNFPSDQTTGGGGPGGKEDDLWSRMEGRFGEGFAVLRAGPQVQVRSMSSGRLMWHNTSSTPVASVELAGDLVLTAADRITARQASDGEFAWDDPMRGGRFAIHPAGDSVLVAHDQGLSRLDLKGNEMWREPYPEEVQGSMPDQISIDDKAVYVTFRTRDDGKGPDGPGGPGGGGPGPKPSQGPGSSDLPPSDVAAFRYS